MNITNVIALFSGIALFLFGMTLMGDGLKKVAGNKLEVILYQLTGTPIKGFLLGTGVTAVIQSSSATSVMVVGFVNSGMMKVRQSISIILGAILGTSITGWVISLSYIGTTGGWLDLFSSATLTGVISVVGIIMRMFSKKPSHQHIGDILMGFAVLMFGMSTMSDAVSPLRESEAFLHILTTFSNPLLGIAFGALFTAVLQSASAACGILQAIAATGMVDFSVALPILMGICIGAAVPVLLSAIGASVDGRRTAFVYLVAETVGVIFWAIAFYAADAIFNFPFMSLVMTPVSVAFVNTMFRLVKVIVLLPFVGLIEKMVDWIIKEKPEKKKKEDDGIHLEERFLDHPALAVEQSRIAINNMAMEAKMNYEAAVLLFDTYSEAGFIDVKKMEERVDVYEDRLGTYLVKLSKHELDSKQNENMSKYLHTISDFERISDHALNIAEAAQELHQKGIQFSGEARREMNVLQSAIYEILDLSISGFVENNMNMAARVEPLEQLIDNLCDEMKLHHVDRLQSGACTLNQGFVFNDLLTDYERIADHCSNIAVAIIELESDSFDTHEYLESVKKMKKGDFEYWYDHYSKQFRL